MQRMCTRLPKSQNSKFITNPAHEQDCTHPKLFYSSPVFPSSNVMEASLCLQI